MLVFCWNERNVEHIATHGVTPPEAEYVVRHARRPYPHKSGPGKWLVHGRANGGRMLQVVYVYPPDDEVDADCLTPADLLAFADGDAEVVYVIHAMPIL